MSFSHTGLWQGTWNILTNALWVNQLFPANAVPSVLTFKLIITVGKLYEEKKVLIEEHKYFLFFL